MRVLNGLILILIILLLSSFVSAKDINISNEDYKLKTKEVTDCNRPDCFIDVELCKKNENKLSKKDTVLYFDDKGKKENKKTVKSKKNVLGCENLNFNVEVPLFSYVKYGFLYDGLDLDPFINNTHYLANFTADISSSSSIVVEDTVLNNTGATVFDLTDSLGIYAFENLTFTDESILAQIDANNTGVTINSSGCQNNNCSWYAGDIDVVNVSNNMFNAFYYNFSYAFWGWVYWEPDGANQYIFGVYTSGNDYGGLRINTDGTLEFALRFSGAWPSMAKSSIKIAPNEWQFIGYTFNATNQNQTYFINDTSELVNPPTINNLNWREWNQICFGASGGSLQCVSDTENLKGGLDEFVVVNKTLTPAEMLDAYNNYHPNYQAIDGFYYSDSFLVNGSMVNFTPTFNTDNGIINISFDNGSSFYNNVSSGVTYNLSNSSYMIYEIFMPTSSYFSDLTLPLGETIFTNISAGIINESLIDYNFSFYEGNNFRPYVNYTNNSNEFITGASCSGKVGAVTINFSYNATTQNYLSDNLFINYSFGTYLYNVSCSKSGYSSNNDLENISVLNTPPIINITEINSVYDGLQAFYNGVSVTTFANYSSGNVTISINDFSGVYSNLTLSYPNGTIITSVINQTIINFNLSAGNYNLSVLANDTNLTTTLDGYFTVSQCIEDWSRTDECSYPQINTTIEYEDLNSCGTFDLPANNGSSEACSYVSIEGAISCIANPNPLIKTFENIEWLCYLNNTGATTTTCISYVAYNDSIIQTNPKPEYVEQIGLVDYFTAQPENSQYQTVSVYFDNKDLINNELVTFGVRCNSEVLYYVFEMNVTPQYKRLSDNVMNRTIWVKENIYFIIILLLGIFVLIVIAGYSIKKFNESKR